MTSLKPATRRSWARWAWLLLAIPILAWVVVRRSHDAPQRAWAAIEASIRQGRWPEAERRLEARVRTDGRDGKAWLRLGAVRAIRGRDDDALAAFGRVSEPDPAWPVAQLQVGEIVIKQRDLLRAEAAFRNAARRLPRAVEPRRRLVFILSLEQRDEEARAVLWELYRITNDPRHLVTLVGLAMARPDVGDPGGDLGPFLVQAPDEPLLRRARGLVRLREGRLAEAEADLEFAFLRIEHDPPGRLALAECRLALGRLDGLDAVLGPEPEPDRTADRARWWRLKGREAEARGRPDEAIACWTRAVEAHPRDHAARYQLGQALARRNDPAARVHLDRAEEARLGEVRLLQALDRNLRGAASPDAFEELARLCAATGLVAEARAWYDQTIRLDPTRASAQAALASLAAPAEVRPEAPRLRARAPGSAGPAPAVARADDGRGRQVVFEDVARRVGVDYAYDCGESGNLFIGDTMGGGVGLIDYDGDGRLDLYFVNGCKLPFDPAAPPRPNRLYRNRKDGTFEDVTARAGVEGAGYGMGCAVGDYDGDGRDDLFVTGLGRTFLYRNRGDGTFEDTTAKAGVASRRWTTAAGFADLDADGDLDLVAVTYVEADMRDVPACRDPLGKPMHCPPGHFPAQADHLFRNNGDGTFTDVAAEAGLDVPNGLGLGLAIADLDGDGRLDLFVANDATPNFFFRNLGGLRFEELGAVSGLAYDGSGRATASMGVVADDLDGDGRLDLFHTNFVNEPNTLHHNLGGGHFDDTTAASGLDVPSRPVTGFGAAALDADNDGNLDLFVANGHVDDRPWVGHPMAQPPHLYIGRGGGRYELAGGEAGPYFGRKVVGRGVAAGDLDNDGRVDLVVVHRDAPAAILRNVSRAGHWLGLRLRSASRGIVPVGARVTCRIGGRSLVRWVTSGTSYLAQNDPRLWFGLGPSAVVDRLEVRWPSGRVQSWEGLAADGLYDLREGQSPAR